MDRRAHCCYVDPALGLSCERDAAWEVSWGSGYEEYTHACTDHVGALLTDAPVHEVRPLGKEPEK